MAEQSQKIAINLDGLTALAIAATRAGTLDRWAEIAIEYAAQCNAEIDRLRGINNESIMACGVVWGMVTEFLDDGPGVGRAEAAEELLRRIRDQMALVRAMDG